MCGILFAILPPQSEIIQLVKDASSKGVLQRRGPDFQDSASVTLEDGRLLYFSGTVLHMRGQLCAQPISQPDSNNILLWNGEIFSGIEVPPDQNDGKILFKLLSRCQNDREILHIFKKLNGPYAFVFYQADTSSVWFGRDVFGRRSLTFTTDQARGFCLSSVALHLYGEVVPGDWTELSAAGLYRWRLDDLQSQVTCFPWIHNDMSSNPALLAGDGEPLQLQDFDDLNMAPIDSAAVQPESVESAAEWWIPHCDTLLSLLGEATRRRANPNSYFCQACHSRRKSCGKAHVAVMFSGGIDSTMLAYLSDLHVPRDQPIDLLNVAFETSGGFDVPDRQTGRKALKELDHSREWNFVEINVTKEELQNARQSRITQLILPLDSVLDDSIGCAIWFASCGKGTIIDRGGHKLPYTSDAKVVLSGLGADEQLGGYSRHRSSYKNSGWQGLLEEINFDIRRISARNLGRDDRVVSDHGKEARFPFLDEQVVSFLNGLPCHHKMNLDLPRGVGEKLLLRACAFKCGLVMSSELAKRAIQFGSRIAKCENRREKGSDKCQRLHKT